MAVERNETSEKIAKMEVDAQREIAANRLQMDYTLKQMGINTDVLLQNMRNLNAKEIEEIRGNIQRNLENLKHENLVSRMMLEFSNNLKMHNFDARAAMRQVLVTNIAKLIGDGKTPWTKIGNVTAWEIASDIVDTTMKSVLDQFDKDMERNMPDLGKFILPGINDKSKLGLNNQNQEDSNEKSQNGTGVKRDTKVTKDTKDTKGESDLEIKGPIIPLVRPGQAKQQKPHVKKKGGTLKK